MTVDKLPNPIRHRYTEERLAQVVRIVRNATKDRRITIHFEDETHLWLCTNLTGWIRKVKGKDTPTWSTKGEARC